MKNENKIGIFLCECGGKISNRIGLPRVSELLNYRTLDPSRDLSIPLPRSGFGGHARPKSRPKGSTGS